MKTMIEPVARPRRIIDSFEQWYLAEAKKHRIELHSEPLNIFQAKEAQGLLIGLSI